jgi:C-terminal processing protease CtpA/Prc
MSKQEVGVGCALGATEQNEVIVKGLVHGGPCHLSCQVGCGDIVMSVDGTPVGGDVKLAKQLFLGEDNSGVTLALRRGGTVKNVHLLRGKTIENRAMKEGEVCGIGITMNPVRDGLVISKIAVGSPAQLSGELQTMDVIVNVAGVDVQGKSPSDASPVLILKL